MSGGLDFTTSLPLLILLYRYILGCANTNRSDHNVSVNTELQIMPRWPDDTQGWHMHIVYCDHQGWHILWIKGSCAFSEPSRLSDVKGSTGLNNVIIRLQTSWKCAICADTASVWIWSSCFIEDSLILSLKSSNFLHLAWLECYDTWPVLPTPCVWTVVSHKGSEVTRQLDKVANSNNLGWTSQIFSQDTWIRMFLGSVTVSISQNALQS